MEREIKREGEGDGRHVSWMISSSGYITYFSASEYDFFVNMDVYTSVFVVVLNTDEYSLQGRCALQKANRMVPCVL